MSTLLKDALANLDPEVGSDPDYARGVLVGVVTSVMWAKACSFAEAVVMVTPHLPEKVDKLAVPDGWHRLIAPSTSDKERRR